MGKSKVFFSFLKIKGLYLNNSKFYILFYYFHIDSNQPYKVNIRLLIFSLSKKGKELKTVGI